MCHVPSQSLLSLSLLPLFWACWKSKVKINFSQIHPGPSPAITIKITQALLNSNFLAWVRAKQWKSKLGESLPVINRDFQRESPVPLNSRWEQSEKGHGFAKATQLVWASGAINPQNKSKNQQELLLKKEDPRMWGRERSCARSWNAARALGVLRLFWVDYPIRLR